MKKTGIILFFQLVAVSLFAQSSVNDQMYAIASKHLAGRNYEAAFPLYQMLLKSDSNNVNYVYGAAQSYCRIGYRQATESAKQNYYKTGLKLAQKAVKLDDKNAEAHFSYALALGRINENAGSKQKIANAKLIKREADRCIELNAKHAGAWHLLGRWHRELASLSSMEKAMVNSFFGGMPTGASNDKAIECFKTAINLESGYILHKYELANTYYKMDDKTNAKTWLAEAMKCEQKTTDDKDGYKKCEELQKELK
jgi:tetratricopeptide (TPR) repeat protein